MQTKQKVFSTTFPFPLNTSDLETVSISLSVVQHPPNTLKRSTNNILAVFKTGPEIY